MVEHDEGVMLAADWLVDVGLTQEEMEARSFAKCAHLQKTVKKRKSFGKRQ